MSEPQVNNEHQWASSIISRISFWWSHWKLTRPYRIRQLANTTSSDRVPHQWPNTPCYQTAFAGSNDPCFCRFEWLLLLPNLMTPAFAESNASPIVVVHKNEEYQIALQLAFKSLHWGSTWFFALYSFFCFTVRSSLVSIMLFEWSSGRPITSWCSTLTFPSLAIQSWTKGLGRCLLCFGLGTSDIYNNLIMWVCVCMYAEMSGAIASIRLPGWILQNV